MSNEFKYKKIIIDDDIQCANPFIEHHLTVEEYNDILNHTHRFSDIVSSEDDSPVDDNLALAISQLNKKNK